MFFRVIRYEYPPEKYDEILAWANTKTELLRGINGLRSVDTFVAGEGEGVVVAEYDSEDAYNAVADTIAGVLGELGEFLVAPPVIHQGTVDWSTRG